MGDGPDGRVSGAGAVAGRGAEPVGSGGGEAGEDGRFRGENSLPHRGHTERLGEVEAASATWQDGHWDLSPLPRTTGGGAESVGPRSSWGRLGGVAVGTGGGGGGIFQTVAVTGTHRTTRRAGS